MGGLILDAGVLVGAMDPDDAHNAGARRALEHVANAGGELLIPATAYAEMLVHPFRKGDAAVAGVDRFIRLLGATVAPVTAETAREAARLRAQHRSLRLADAVVLGLALSAGAGVITTDHGWPVIPGVPVDVLAVTPHPRPEEPG